MFSFLQDVTAVLQYTNFTFCPKCGSTELLLIEENGIKCDTCNYVYFHNVASAAGAIVLAPSGILLIKRAHEPKKGLLDIPGGFVNYNESIEDALRREVNEELSCTVQEMAYFGSFPNVYKYGTVTYFTADSIFVCKFDQDPVIKPNNEVEEYAWYKPDAIQLDQFAFESTKAAFRKFLSSM